MEDFLVLRLMFIDRAGRGVYDLMEAGKVARTDDGGFILQSGADDLATLRIDKSENVIEVDWSEPGAEDGDS